MNGQPPQQQQQQPSPPPAAINNALPDVAVTPASAHQLKDAPQAIARPGSNPKIAPVYQRLTINLTPEVARPSESEAGKTAKHTPAHAITTARRRLSVSAGSGQYPRHTIDGSFNVMSPGLAGDGGLSALIQRDLALHKRRRSSGLSEAKEAQPPKPALREVHQSSQVGYVPFNPEKINQDRSFVHEEFRGDRSQVLLGCMDGHGSVGDEVSSYVCRTLPVVIAEQEGLDRDTVKSLDRAFVQCNTSLCSSKIDCMFSGTTVLVVYLTADKIWSCNVGDSRAVLAQQLPDAEDGTPGRLRCVELSSDQKPERPDENKRMKSRGARIEPCYDRDGTPVGPLRVWLPRQQVPGLAMTRSFGDKVAASVGVSAHPEIWVRNRSPNDRFIILASDGVWEFISSEEAVSLVKECKTAEQASQALVDEATRRWKKEEEVIDDITAVVAFL